MPTCNFCKENYEFPKGITVVGKDGNARHYCSSKCRKNVNLGRLTKKVKWIQKGATIKAEKAKREARKKA